MAPTPFGQSSSVAPATPSSHSHASSSAAASSTRRELTSWRARLERRFRSKDEEKAPPPGVFGVPLQTSIKYAHVAISLSNPEGQPFVYGYIPTIVAKCGIFLKDKATEVEGIFRLAGAERRMREMQVQFDSPETYGKDFDWTGCTPHDVANLFRRYLNKLPEPIVPLEYYDRFRAPLQGHQAQAVGPMDHQYPSSGDFSADAAIIEYQKLITQLPPHNRQLLLYLLDLLAFFAAKSEFNLMTASNLSSIFQPGILRHPQHDMSPLEYRLNQDILIFLIDNQDFFLWGMQGTEADIKTIQEVQSSEAATSAKKSSSPVSKILGRSASTASAGAESGKRIGALRRNKSTSSKGSNNSPLAGTPPATSSPLTPKNTSGGVFRRNTVPSKKSAAPDTNTAIDKPLAEEEAVKLNVAIAPQHKKWDHSNKIDSPSSNKTSPKVTPLDTPSKERHFPLFGPLSIRQSGSDSEKKETKKPNKLQKKRVADKSALSPQGSSLSLVSPSTSRADTTGKQSNAPVTPMLLDEIDADSSFGLRATSASSKPIGAEGTVAPKWDSTTTAVNQAQIVPTKDSAVDIVATLPAQENITEVASGTRSIEPTSRVEKSVDDVTSDPTSGPTTITTDAAIESSISDAAGGAKIEEVTKPLPVTADEVAAARATIQASITPEVTNDFKEGVPIVTSAEKERGRITGITNSLDGFVTVPGNAKLATQAELNPSGKPGLEEHLPPRLKRLSADSVRSAINSLKSKKSNDSKKSDSPEEVSKTNPSSGSSGSSSRKQKKGRRWFRLRRDV